MRPPRKLMRPSKRDCSSSTFTSRYVWPQQTLATVNTLPMSLSDRFVPERIENREVEPHARPAREPLQIDGEVQPEVVALAQTLAPAAHRVAQHVGDEDQAEHDPEIEEPGPEPSPIAG